MIISAFNIPPVKANKTIVVPDDYPTIQIAINAANPRDTVYVKEGIYYDHVVVNKAISLIGENRNSIIDGKNSGTVVWIKASNVNITGFTIQNSGVANESEAQPYFVGIDIHDCCNHNTIRDNNIRNNEVGINMFTVKYNTFIENDVTDNQYGICDVWSKYNTYVDNNIVDNSGIGLSLFVADYHTLIGNNIENNIWGISFIQCHNNILRNNTIVGNEYNFAVFGLWKMDFINDVDTSNTVDGKPVYYWVNKENQTVPSDAGFVVLANSVNITVSNLNIENNDEGIVLGYTKDSLITKNNIRNNRFGIYSVSSPNNTISRNNVDNNSWHGIESFYSSNNLISGNTITNNKKLGILLWGGSKNQVFGNNLTNNQRGIGMWFGSSGNTISENIISGSYGTGLALDSDSSHNIIYHNYFTNNRRHAWISSNSHGNVWDDGYPSGGNYWSDYNGTDIYSGPYQNETGSDGIGDIPYVIDEKNQDKYPLIKPPKRMFLPEDLNYDKVVDIKDIAIAAAAFGSYPGHARWDSVADVNKDGTVDMKDVARVASKFGETI